MQLKKGESGVNRIELIKLHIETMPILIRFKFTTNKPYNYFNEIGLTENYNDNNERKMRKVQQNQRKNQWCSLQPIDVPEMYKGKSVIRSIYVYSGCLQRKKK